MSAFDQRSNTFAIISNGCFAYKAAIAALLSFSVLQKHYSAMRMFQPLLACLVFPDATTYCELEYNKWNP